MNALATWLVLAWKNAGWIGADRYLLPYLGTPWKRGALFIRSAYRDGVPAASPGH